MEGSGSRRIELPQLRRFDVSESDARIGDPSRGLATDRKRHAKRWEGREWEERLCTPCADADAPDTSLSCRRPARVYCHNATDREHGAGASSALHRGLDELLQTRFARV